MTSKLNLLAARLRRAVAAKPYGWVNYTFPGGLDIILSRNGEKWRLALRREKVFPSDVELAILTQAFAVPDGVERASRRSVRRHAPQNRPDGELVCD